ncbi:MAG: glycosyltransferase [Clostridium sp.]
MDKLLTVIIPVYNKIAYLKQCLDSVLSQNLNKIKIVVVDDGSTDESEKICDRYKQKMTVIHQEHKGLIAARERGLREADTKYVTFVDADDFIAGGMYEYMLSKADEYDADIVTCGCIRYWNEDDYAYDLCSEFQEGIYEKKEIEDSIIKKMLWSKEKDGWCLDPSLCMKIIKTELVKEQYTQIAGNNFLYGEDSAIIYPLIFRVNKIYISTAPYYYHRQRERTITAPYFVEEDFF